MSNPIDATEPRRHRRSFSKTMNPSNYYLPLAAAALSLLAAASPTSAADFFLKDGDRVVMIGDSITEQYLHSTYVETWALTRFPAWNVTFVNVGIGGDTSPGGNNRFKRDVLAYNPTAMTVNFGMNDAGAAGNVFNEGRYKSYMTGLQSMADQAKAANIRVAWLTTSPVEIPAEGPSIMGENLNLEKFCAGVKQIAETNGGALFVDHFHPFAAVIDKARAANPKNRIGGGDAVHPGPPGQVVMAEGILKGMSFPTVVASVEIDAGSKKVVQNQNCAIDGVKVNAEGKIEFQQTDRALPFFPEEAKAILQWASVIDEMNDYRLKATGLAEGRYEVRLGGVKIADYAAAELGAGVNIAAAALAAGPIAEQVKAVRAAIKTKNDFFHDKIFRGVVLASGVPDFLELTKEEVETKRAAALKARTEKLPELFAAIRTALVIQPHLVEIVRSAGQ